MSLYQNSTPLRQKQNFTYSRSRSYMKLSINILLLKQSDIMTQNEICWKYEEKQFTYIFRLIVTFVLNGASQISVSLLLDVSECLLVQTRKMQLQIIAICINRLYYYGNRLSLFTSVWTETFGPWNGSSETLVSMYKTTLRHNTEDHDLEMRSFQRLWRKQIYIHWCNHLFLTLDRLRLESLGPAAARGEYYPCPG
jgi:hypothetical protein